MKRTMGTLLIVMMLSVLVHSQHLDEDPYNLMATGAVTEGHNLQSIDSEDMKGKVAMVMNTSNLKEFEDHAEIQAETNSPKETFIPPTPSPKLVPDADSSGELDGRNNNTLSTPETLPTPVPVLLYSGKENDELVNKDEYEKLSSTKKSSVVPKKGVTFEEPSVVPKKGADPEKLKPSVTARKGADPKTKKPSVTPRKDADPSLLLESSSTALDNTTVSSSGKTVTFADSLKHNLDAKNTENGQTFRATDLNMFDSEKQKTAPPKAFEAGMDFRTSTSEPILLAAITSSPPTKIPTKAAGNADSEPVKPLTTDPVTTEAYTTLRSKPTAATDSLDSAAEDEKIDSMSYTPAVVGIVLLVAIVVTVIVVGYRRLQDVWMRRHYARMDFLIDGMYDM